MGRQPPRQASLRSVRFRYRSETLQQAPLPHVGVIAQSMPPEVVHVAGNGTMGIGLADTLGYAIGAIRGLRAETRESDSRVRRTLQRELGSFARG